MAKEKKKLQLMGIAGGGGGGSDPCYQTGCHMSMQLSDQQVAKEACRAAARTCLALVYGTQTWFEASQRSEHAAAGGRMAKV
jgi:hypothetical protein